MSQKISVCVVGLGRAGQFHLNSIRLSNAFALQYVVDTNIALAESEATQHNCKAVSLDEALQDAALDAVIISTPTDYHYGYIRQALLAGKHVFTEKPLGHSLEEIMECFDLAAKKGLALYLGFQRRYDKNFQALKAALPTLGDSRILKASSRDNPRPSIAYLSISGNIFHDMLIHDFDMLCFLFGSELPTQVYAKGTAYDPEIKALNDYDTVMVHISYPSGLICSIDTSRTAPYGYDQRIEVFGANGMLLAENEPNNTVKLFTDKGQQQSPFNHSFPERYKAAYVIELEAFATGISTGTLNNVLKQECMLAHLLADAAYESATSGKVVPFQEVYGKYF